MSDPRAVTDLEGIGFHGITKPIDGSTITYDITKTDGSAGVGFAVSLSSTGAAQLASDGEHIVGKLINVESDGFCTIQDDGYTTLPLGTSATVTPGNKFVGALGPSNAKGYIRGAASANAAELNGPPAEVVGPADANGNVPVEF